jgi:hypothetical protein
MYGFGGMNRFAPSVLLPNRIPRYSETCGFDLAACPFTSPLVVFTSCPTVHCASAWTQSSPNRERIANRDMATQLFAALRIQPRLIMPLRKDMSKDFRALYTLCISRLSLQVDLCAWNVPISTARDRGPNRKRIGFPEIRSKGQ